MITTVLTLLLGLVVIVLITALTGYFVAQEFAFMGVDRTRLAVRADGGDAVAAAALDVTRRTSFMLSGAQLGITVTGLVVGYVAEPLVGAALGTLLGGTGLSTAVSLAVGTVTALLLSTVVQMVLGELFPKNYAIARPEPVALRLARSTNLYLTVLGPVIRVFDASSNALLRAVRMEPVHDVEHAATSRDLVHLVATARETGDIPEAQAILLDRILDFPERTVDHAMIPRPQVDVLDPATTVAQLRPVLATGHSRYPVVDDDERILGVLHLADVLPRLDDHAATAESLARPALVVSELSTLPVALRTMDAERQQLACVVDEHGGFSGILTVEDLAEEVVGEITDEHDEPEDEPAPVAAPGAEGEWEVPGSLHLDELARTVGDDIDYDAVETVGGLVVAAHGSLPAVGQVVRVELAPDAADLVETDDPPRRFLDLEVLDVERHVPSRVRATTVTREQEDVDREADLSLVDTRDEEDHA